MLSLFERIPSLPSHPYFYSSAIAALRARCENFLDHFGPSYSDPQMIPGYLCSVLPLSLEPSYNKIVWLEYVFGDLLVVAGFCQWFRSLVSIDCKGVINRVSGGKKVGQNVSFDQAMSKRDLT